MATLSNAEFLTPNNTAYGRLTDTRITKNSVLRTTILASACALSTIVGEPKLLAAQTLQSCPNLPVSTVESGIPATAQIARVIQRFMPTAGAMAIAWSPDGKLLATLGGLRERVALWKPETATLIWEQAGNLGGGEAIAFSNDGKLIIVSAMSSGPEDEHIALHLLDVSTGRIVGRVPGPFPHESTKANFARKIAIDRQRSVAAVIAAKAPGRPVALYDMRSWVLKATVTVPGDTPEAVAFSSDGSLAVGTVGGKIVISNAETRAVNVTIETKEFIKSLAYSPDGKYIAAGFFSLRMPIQIRSTSDGALLCSCTGDLSTVQGIAWSPDGQYVASASFDKTARLWPFGRDIENEVVTRLNTGAWSVAFSPDGRLLAVGSSGSGVVIAAVK
jgi:WD40 repeat protein